MKKILWLLLVTGIIMFGLNMITPTVKADDEDKPLAESIMGLYTITESLELGIQPLYRLTGSGKIDSIKWYNLSANSIMNPNTGFKINLGYMSYQVIEQGTNLTIGEVRNVMFRPTLYQTFLPHYKKINPFVGGGFNFYRAFDEKALLPGQKMWFTRDYVWGLHLATGVRYLPNQNMLLSLDIYRDWMLSKFDVARSVDGRGVDLRGSGRLLPASVNLNMWAYGLNFSFRF
jgi:outer membrane protein W